MLKASIRPTLHAFLFCRAVKQDGRGIASLDRPFAKLLLPRGQQLPVQHRFFVYHHWGGGQGAFTERLEVIGPGGESVLSHPEGIRFAADADFYDVLIDCRVLVHQLGNYHCKVFLDGELAGERSLPIILA